MPKKKVEWECAQLGIVRKKWNSDASFDETHPEFKDIPDTRHVWVSWPEHCIRHEMNGDAVFRLVEGEA